ncbi:hypothetical protein HIM_07852 [Hirsutella minnesotensis 3608]|uniref:Benzoate 4-monooxygenase cytochrome P450 n=1 Tax=Hirsutella minnesotensis 3608 TaxID=1043627 RepID=A0A0F7ZYN4_9HYPO|nr:hypothetical protein HIM_07852 [Hirsutella minnesotensis 3608]
MALFWTVLLTLKYIFYVAVLIKLIQRLALHPLRKFPGPLLAKASYGYGGYYAMKKYPHIQIYKNFQKYGPVFRAAPNRLVFNTLTAVRDIYLCPNVTKAVAYRNSRWDSKPHIFDVTDRRIHRQKRRVVGQVLADKSLRTFQPIILQQVDILIKVIREGLTKPINMTEISKRFAMDVIGCLAFGYELKTQTEDTNAFISRAMNKAVYLNSIYYTWPAVSYIAPVVRWAAKGKSETFWTAVRNMIISRMAEPLDAKPDFYSIAANQLESTENQDQLEESELWAEALLFITAGGSTIASALASLLFNLSRHRHVYDRLASQIRDSFSSGHEIKDDQKLIGLKYLRAVIDESLRLSPSSLFTPWRVADKPTAPLVVDGNVIPYGTEVSVHLYSILHNAEFFPAPFAFQPERWLIEERGPAARQEAEARLAIMRQAHVAFGIGERVCAGKSMAYQELSVVIAKLLWYFDFSQAPGEAGKLGCGPGADQGPWAAPDQFFLQDIFAADHDGPNLVFQPREVS